MRDCSSFLSRGQTQFKKNRLCSFLQFLGTYLRALPVWVMESLKTKCKTLVSSRGCFGCCKKSTNSVIAVNEASKGIKIQGKVVKKNNLSDEFWSTSACEVEDSNTLQSQRSVSSISTAHLPLDPQSSKNNPSDFVNHGRILWNQTRQQWLAAKTSQKQPQIQEPAISLNATYESLLSTNKLFPRRIPLKEMVHFLADVWEQEGLYD